VSIRLSPNREGEAPAEPDRDESDLPEGWAPVRLPDVAKLVMGQSPPSTTYNTEQRGLPFFQGKAEFGEMYPTPRKFCDTPGKIADPDDILMSIRAPVGPTNLCATRSCIGRGLAAIRAREGIPPLYLLYFFRSIEEWLSLQGTGSTFTAINKDDLSSIELPLAPLAEQRRIVAKLEELLGRVSRAKARLDRIPALLKRFRQSVLAAACSGKLTADWREENPCESLEKLLLASLRGNKKLYDALQNDSRFKSSTPFDWDMFPTIDTTWSWASAAEVVQPGSEIVYGIVQPGPEVSDGIPYVRGMDIQDGRILIHQLKRTSREIAERYERASLKCGDVLLGIIRNTKVAIVPEQLSGGNITQGTARFRPSEFVSTGFLALWLTSKYAQDWLHMHYRGIDMPGLNLADVRKLPVPLPPIVEQLEIERRVEQLFAFADQIEARLTRAQAQVDRLTQSILAKAFRGELVPTEAELARRERRDYEPASKLLERVCGERVAERPPKTTTKPRKSLRGARNNSSPTR
jgi:type I restriction enzyme, S subunit